MVSVKRMLVICILLSLSALLLNHPVFPVHAQPSGASVVFVSPLNNSCCMGPVGTRYTVSVMVNLTAGQSINVFAVRLNYSHIWNPPFTPNGVLRAVSLDYSNNIFSGFATNIAFECMDGFPVNNHGCAPDDSGLGSVDFEEFASGSGAPGPIINGLLFQLTFTVNATGSSVFSFNRIFLINPSVDSSGPHPHFLQYVTRGGVFANKGVAAFFNAEPVSPPSIVAGQPGVLFDGTGSFDADNPALTIQNYTWNFGDGTVGLTKTQPTVLHLFFLPGNYSVRLVVADQSGKGNVTRNVDVLPNLGTLRLNVKDLGGNPLGGSVVAQLFNSSRPTSPFENSTTNLAGLVTFYDLSPGSYSISFKGTNVEASSVSEYVFGGWLTEDTVYLKVDAPITTSPPDYRGDIFFGSLAAVLVVFTAAMIVRRRRGRRIMRTSSLSAG